LARPVREDRPPSHRNDLFRQAGFEAHGTAHDARIHVDTTASDALD
jgi:hypothetical protein